MSQCLIMLVDPSSRWKASEMAFSKPGRQVPINKPGSCSDHEARAAPVSFGEQNLQVCKKHHNWRSTLSDRTVER